MRLGTLEALNKKLVQIIDPRFRVDFGVEEDLFLQCTIDGVECLVQGTLHRLDTQTDFVELRNQDWTLFDDPGDTSRWVNALQADLQTHLVEGVLVCLPEMFAQTFCSQLAETLISHIAKTLLMEKENEVGEMGAQQLVVDMDALSGILVEIARDFTFFNLYSSFVSKTGQDLRGGIHDVIHDGTRPTSCWWTPTRRSWAERV